MMAKSLESYAEFMELNVWTGTQLVSAIFDQNTKDWQITLRRTDGSERMLFDIPS
jgi:putative flavoprotein involved in K+ transport